MTECQGCGAWNEATRSVCVLCGTPLAETDEWDAGQDLPPLPPLPDGGLGASMPAWLRALPHLAQEEIPASTPPALLPLGAAPAALAVEAPPLGPRADPRTFLTDEDFPRWLRDLAAREVRTVPTAVSETATPATERLRPADWPDWPGLPTSANPSNAQDGTPPSPADGRPPAAVVAARALAERRSRPSWETLLLVILFIGVVAAALWALVSNGVFSPSL